MVFAVTRVERLGGWCLITFSAKTGYIVP